MRAATADEQWAGGVQNVTLLIAKRGVVALLRERSVKKRPLPSE
jgi:hypothetical protein